MIKEAIKKVSSYINLNTATYVVEEGKKTVSQNLTLS